MKELYRYFPAIFVCAMIFILPLSRAVHAGDGWKFQATPYAWLAGQKGTVTPVPGLPSADIDIDFYDDVLGNINGALFYTGEARKGRFGILMDLAYTDIEDDNATPGPLFSSLTVRTKNWMISAAGLYRLVQAESAFMDAFAGLRYWSAETRLNLGAGVLPGRSVKNRDDWVDPFVGLKGRLPLGMSKFFINGGLLIGGFGVGSDFMWDGNINLGYQWTDSFSTTVGYRYLDVDYSNDGFLYDIAQDGMILGFSWGW